MPSDSVLVVALLILGYRGDKWGARTRESEGGSRNVLSCKDGCGWERSWGIVYSSEPATPRHQLGAFQYIYEL